MSTPKNVLLVGYGAVGAIYSLILKRGGQASVTVVARSNYEATKKNGMHFKSRKYGDIPGWRPDRLFSSVEQALDIPYSHVVLTTKAIPELTRTPDLLAPLLTPEYTARFRQPTYVLMQNGLGVERDLYAALKKLDGREEPRIISTAVWIGTNLVEKDVVEHNDFDRVSLGIYRPTTTETSNTPAEAALLEEFRSMLVAGGSDAKVVPEIQRIKYSKNFWNCVMGATAAISRAPLNAVFRPPERDPPAGLTYKGPSNAELPDGIATRSNMMREHAIPFLRGAMEEIYALGRELFPDTPDGPGLDPDIVQTTLRRTSELNSYPESSHRASMLVDAETGRPLELDVVVGEVVRLGKERGISMPRIDAIYALLLIVQEQLLEKHRARE